MEEATIQEQFELLRPRLRTHGISQRFADVLVRTAFSQIFNVFAGSEIRILPEIAILTISNGVMKMPIDILDEVLPALAFALEYFGEIPEHLLKKLRNRSQTADTIFELYCMAVITQAHKIDYEPRLIRGKVPDFKIKLPPDVYVECKAQRLMEAQAQQRFQKLGSDVLAKVEQTEVVQSAWLNNFRTEIRFRRTPNSKEIEGLPKILSEKSLQELSQGIVVGSSFDITAVPRSQRLSASHLYMANLRVSTEPITVAPENAHVLAYSWPTIDKQIARTQRKLLADARVQLRGIPEGACGMICLQTLLTHQLRLDLHHLIDQPQFEHVPIIWVNPNMKNSRVIFRDDGTELMHRIFDPIKP
jgi:hypothetical protein